MVTTKNGTGIAKIASISLAVLLLAGVAGSLVMGARARSAALENAVTQAKAIADGSLSLVFRPDDVDGVAADARADMLSDQIGSVVIDPSDFDTVTLWSPTAEILYATEEGRIGNQLDGERDRIREALRGAPQTRVSDGSVSVMLPLRFESGVGEPATVELTTSDDPVEAAGAPWRTMALFSGLVLLFAIGLVVWIVRRPDRGRSSPRRPAGRDLAGHEALGGTARRGPGARHEGRGRRPAHGRGPGTRRRGAPGSAPGPVPQDPRRAPGGAEPPSRGHGIRPAIPPTRNGRCRRSSVRRCSRTTREARTSAPVPSRSVRGSSRTELACSSDRRRRRRRSSTR